MTARPRVSPVDLALTAALVLGAGVAFGWVFGWTGGEALVWAAIAASVVGAVVVGGSLRHFGLGAVAVVVVQVVACLAVGTALVAAAGGGVDGFVGGLVDAWSSLLSFTLPAGGDPTLLVVPIVLCWFAAAVATEAVLRSRSPFAPALVAIGLLVAARLFGPGTADLRIGHVALAVTMVVLGLLLAARRSAELDSAARARPATEADVGAGDAAAPTASGWLRAGVPVAVAAALLGGAVALVVPLTRSAATLRNLVEPPPPADLAVANPLDSLTSDLSTVADQPVLDVTLTVGSVPEGTSMLGGASPPLRVVTLDTYDGVEWSSSGRYLRAGSELPAPVGASATTVEVRQEITIAALDGPWLPAASWPRTVEVDGAGTDAPGAPILAFDATTGGLVLENPTPGQPVRYTVVSQVPAVTAAQLQEAPLPSSSAFAPDIALPPGLPDSLGAVADQAMGRAASPFQQLAALERWMRTNGELDLDAPGGNSYGALERFLAPDARQVATPAGPAGPAPGTVPAVPGAGSVARIGTPQQFATAFVVLARSHGLPARVVIGYRTDAAASGTTSIVRGDSAVWPEAYLDGVGWAAFDPIPAAGTAPATPAEQPSVDEVTQAKTDAAAQVGSPDQSIPPASNPIVEAEAAESSRSLLWFALAALVVVVLVVLVVLVGRPVRARRRRRRLERDRRGAATTRARVLGAWHHVVDTLEAHGAPALASATAADVADVAAARWGAVIGDQVRGLGRLVNDTLFDPDGLADPSTASTAWQLADAVVAAVAAAPPVPVDPADAGGGAGPPHQLAGV